MDPENKKGKFITMPIRAAKSGKGAQYEPQNNEYLTQGIKSIFHIMNFLAKRTLAAGGSPVMSHHVEEVEEMVATPKPWCSIWAPLTLTWSRPQHSPEKANQLNIPVVLDPVGVGATAFRRRAVTETALLITG